MKKKLFLAFFIFLLFFSAGLVYLNNIFLPKKIKSLIVNGIKEATGRNVELGRIQFSIFKGLVLEGLNINDGAKPILRVKEASCTFLLLPLLSRRIIIPAVRIKQGEIFIRRNSDNTFNIFPVVAAGQPDEQALEKAADDKPAAAQVPKTISPEKNKFSVIISSVIVKGSRVDFLDDMLSPAFSVGLEDVNMSCRLSLPASLKFNFKARIKAEPVMNISAQGEYRISSGELSAKILLGELSPGRFHAYLKPYGIEIPEGLINALIDVKSKEGNLAAETELRTDGVVIKKENISAVITSGIKAKAEYGLNSKFFKFSGKATINEAVLSGIEQAEQITGIKGEIGFDDSGIFAEKLNADIFGVPVIARGRLNNFQNPELEINLASVLNLDSAQGVLREKFNLNFPAQIKGNASLVLKINASAPFDKNILMSGYLDIINARIKPEKLESALEDVSGKIVFDRAHAEWQGVNFKYLGLPYNTSGSISDFSSPKANLSLKSRDFSLDSSLAVNKNIITLSVLQGKYLKSEFSLTGKVDTSDNKTQADISGTLKLEASDLSKLLPKFREQIEKASPSGLLNARFTLSGNINDFKSCALAARVSGEQINAYGLKVDSIFMDYNQANGSAGIPLVRLALYDGRLEASAGINLASENLPYWLSLDAQGVKLEKLKMDTGVRKKEIAGILSLQAKINGFSDDASKLNGAGKIMISEGRLWELNLFKGLGSLMFARDFSNIVFSEGYCDFLIKNKQVLSENITLKSNIADINGNARIGFDGSLDAFLNIKVLDERAPLSGGFKDLTTAIMGEAGRFGVIKISGTLKEPKYKFKPAVGDIIKGLKDAIFGK